MNSIRRNQDDQPRTYRCYEPPPQGYVDAKPGQSLGGNTAPVGGVDYFLPIEQEEEGEDDSSSVSSNGGQCCCCCCGCCGLIESGGSGGRDACREISIHGLRRMVARRRKARQRSSACRCFIWGLLLFVCLCAFVYTATDCILLYLSEPLASKQTFRYDPMNRLPAITLCNLNPLRLSEMAQQKLPITSHDAPADDDRRFVAWRDVNVSSLDVHLSASHRREKMIISCTLSNQPCDSSKYVKTLTEFGLCFTLRPNASDLRLLLNAEQYEHYSFRGQEDDDDTGFLMVFHEPEINGPAVPVRTGMKLAPGRRASVGLRRTDVTLLSTRSTPCSQDGANSFSHCVTSCEIDIISRHCGCRPFWAAVTGEWLSSSSADCVCQTPCQFTEYHWDFSFSDLVSTSVLKPDALLSDSKLAEMNDDRCRAANIRSKSTKAIWRNDEEQISELVRSLDDVAYRVELFQVNLRVVAQHFHESVLALQARLAFHSYVGLAGMRKSFTEGFAKAFETVRERSLETLTSGFYERVAELERSIKQLMFTSTSESILRKVVYYMMDNQLSSKLEIAIQTLDNLTKVYYSFLNSDPSYATNLTPEKRYDAQLIPYEVLSEVQDSLKLCYGGISDNIAGLIDHILALKTILKDVFQRNALNETAFDHSKRAFIAGVLRVKEYVAMFEEKVIAKSIRSLNLKVEELDVLNRSLSDSLLIIVQRLAHLQDELSDSYSGPYSQILSFSQLCQRYTQDDAAVKSSLAVTALDLSTESAMDLLRKILRRLKSGSGEVSELWRSAEDMIKTIWKRFLEEDALSDFYKSLYNDVKEMASHSQRADIYRGLFMNPMLLGMEEMRWSLQTLGGRFGSSPSGTQANDFYAKLNADFPTMNYSSKMTSVEEELRRFDKETNFDAMLEGKNEKLENAFQTLHENLAEFQDQCRQNSYIIRDNVMLVDVRMVSNVIRNNNETSSFTLVTLFGQIGGLLALFLGASLVTCVEIIDVAFQCACPTGSRPKKTKSAKLSNSNHHVLFKPVDMADHDSYALPVTSSMGDHQHGRNHNNKAPGSSANKIKVDATYQRKRGQEDAETDI